MSVTLAVLEHALCTVSIQVCISAMLQLHNTCCICTIAAATAFERYRLSAYYGMLLMSLIDWISDTRSLIVLH